MTAPFLIDILCPVPAMSHPLDLAAPLRSLRAIAGADGVPMTGKALGQARGVAQATACQAEAGGEGITLSTLRRYAEAVGYRLVLSVEPLEDTPGRLFADSV